MSEAAQERQTVLLDYVPADGGKSTRKFDVFGLVFRGGRWYMAGYCHLRMGMRTLRVDRVARTEVSQLVFARPEAFDPAAYLTQTLATLPFDVRRPAALGTTLARLARRLAEQFC